MSKLRLCNAVAIANLAWLSGCGDEVAANADRPAEVEVQRGPLILRWTAHAELRPIREVEIRSATDGAAAILHLAPEGQLVQVGEVVAELDTSELRARRSGFATELERSRRQVARAEAARQIQDAETRAVLVERQGALRTARFDLDTFHDRTVSLEEAEAERGENRWARAVDDARLALERAELAATTEAARLDAQLLGAQHLFDTVADQLALCDEQIDSAVLRAPFDGTVVRMADTGDDGGPLDVGSMVRRFQRVLAVVDTSTMVIRARIPAAIGEVDERAVAEVRVDALPGLTLAGRLTDVEPEPPGSSPPSATYREVQVSIEAPAGAALAPGISATIALDCARIDDALHLPLEAIGHRGGVHFVWKVTPAGAVSTPVTVGRFDATRAEILAGISAGDRVVLRPPSTTGD